MNTSLHPSTGRPFHIKGSDGRVINVRVVADEKDEVFVVGSFERLEDFLSRARQGGDLLKPDRERLVERAFRVLAHSVHRELPIGAEQCFTPVNPPDPARSDDVLVVEDAVIHEQFFVADDGVNQVTLDHDLVPFEVTLTEGAQTALWVLRQRVDDARIQEAA